MDQDFKDRAFSKLEEINSSLNGLNLGAPLTWLAAWSEIDYLLDDEENEATASREEIFNALFDDADRLGLSLEYGIETLSETIHDWIFQRGLLKERE